MPEELINPIELKNFNGKFLQVDSFSGFRNKDAVES